MAATSGKAGTVLVGATAVAQVTKWTFEPSAPIHKWASNSTGGYKAAVSGPKDGKGTIETKVDTDILWTVGQSVTLILRGPTSGDNITVPALISSAPVTVDIDNGEPIGSTYSFESNGAWTGAGIFAGID